MAQDRRIKLVVIGGSAGSLEVLLQLLPQLQVPIGFALVIVLHRKSTESILVELLADRTHLPVKEAEDTEPLHPGTIYVAPPGYHTLLEGNGSLSLDCSEKVNWSRPSIDVTFETAAEVYGETLVGILLSGANRDGVAGLRRIAAQGGLVWVQDPATAQVAYMPQSAVEDLQVDRLLRPEEMAAALNAL